MKYTKFYYMKLQFLLLNANAQLQWQTKNQNIS